MIQIALGDEIRWPLEPHQRWAVVVGIVAWLLLVLGLAMAPEPTTGFHPGLLAGPAAVVGSASRRFVADRSRGYPHALARAILQASIWLGLMIGVAPMASLHNPFLAADSLAPAAAVVSVGFGLVFVSAALWERLGRQRAVLWAAWGGLALIGLGAVAAIAGSWPFAIIWLVPGSALVVWQALERRRLR